MTDLVPDLIENLKLYNESENDLKQLAKEEINRLVDKLDFSEPEDSKNAILEIRAGTGGEEAELFAGELARMYLKYFDKKGIRATITDQSDTPIGGVKQIVMSLTGRDAYGEMKFEGGVHRVQRVPKTEKSGRLHTSAATVVVLPEIEEKLIEIRPDEIRVDVFRSSGHGGQSVNTTDSAVRITHLPTGMIVTCQDEKSQIKNREKAMKELRSRLWQKQQEQELKESSEKRLSMIGSGDRSEKIRTYNFPQDRITDHRISKSWSNIEKILDGFMDPIIADLHHADKKIKLENILAEEGLKLPENEAI